MIKIRTLKHTYHSTAIIRTLNNSGFTIYRAKIRADMRSRSDLIEWRVSIPEKYNDRERMGTYFNLLNSAVHKILFDVDGVTVADAWVQGFDFGFYKILDCQYQNQMFQVCQHFNA